jgi:hypothetical protein
MAVKLRTNLKPGTNEGSGTLYIINLDNSLNTERLVDSTKSFLKKAKLEKIKVEKLLSTDVCDFGKTDGVVIVGNDKSVVFHYAITNEEIFEFLTVPDYSDYLYWVKNNHESYIETSRHFLTLISSNSENTNFWYTQWDRINPSNGLSTSDMNRKYRLLGFIILHSTSHMAGYVHFDSPPGLENYTPGNISIGVGYGDKPGVISNFLHNVSGTETFEKLINWTISHHKHMIDETKKRFGY